MTSCAFDAWLFCILIFAYMSRIVRKPDFCLGENKGADQLISAFVFATRIVYFLFFLYPQFQASSLLLSLYSPVCVRPGQKSRRPVFSRRGSWLGSNETLIWAATWENRSSGFPTRSDTNRAQYSLRSRLEAWNFGYKKKRKYTIRVAKTKALISFAVTAKLICAFVFA